MYLHTREHGIVVPAGLFCDLAELICATEDPLHIRYQTTDIRREARSLEARDSLNGTRIPGRVREHRQSMVDPDMQLGLPVVIVREKKFINALLSLICQSGYQ